MAAKDRASTWAAVLNDSFQELLSVFHQTFVGRDAGTGVLLVFQMQTLQVGQHAPSSHDACHRSYLVAANTDLAGLSD